MNIPKKDCRVYFLGIGGLDSRLKTSLPGLSSFSFRSDPWIFYLEQQKVRYPFRAISVRFYRKLGRSGTPLPLFPFQGQFFFSSPGRTRIRSLIWRRHRISALLDKFSTTKLKKFLYLKKMPRLVRFFSQASPAKQIVWKTLFCAQLFRLISFGYPFLFQLQRKLDIFFHPWIFSLRKFAFYSMCELNFARFFFSQPPNLKPFFLPRALKLPVRFRKRFYRSIWTSNSFDWHGNSAGLVFRPVLPRLFPEIPPSILWLQQRPGFP